MTHAEIEQLLDALTASARQLSVAEMRRYRKAIVRLENEASGYIKAILTEFDAAQQRREACESALVAMVQQYCEMPYNKIRGLTYTHEFMSAGEEAFTYLVEHGLAKHCENNADIYFPEDEGDKNGRL